MTGHTTPAIADPAAAPSVEQIAEVIDGLYPNMDNQEAIGRIHDLYGTPGDAGETPNFSEPKRSPEMQAAADEAERRIQAENRVEELEAQIERHRVTAQEHAVANGGCVPANAYNELAENYHAEVERHKAALEAAKWLLRARSKAVEAERELIAAQRALETRGTERFEAQEAFEAALAAVEAETSEEAGA